MKIKLYKTTLNSLPTTQIFGANPQDYAKFGLKGHNGWDLGVQSWTPLFSCIEGVCTESMFDEGGYGNYVKIENEYCAVLYAHLSVASIKYGDTVKVNQEIGKSGNTGNSTGPHLHFAVHPIPRNKKNGYNGYIDPLNPDLVEWLNLDQIIMKPSEALPKEFFVINEVKDFNEVVKKDKVNLVLKEKDAFDTVMDKVLQTQTYVINKEAERGKVERTKLIEEHMDRENAMQTIISTQATEIEHLKQEPTPVKDATQELGRLTFFGVISYLTTEAGVAAILNIWGNSIDPTQKLAITTLLLGVFRWVDKYLHEKSKGEVVTFKGLTPSSLLGAVKTLF